MWHNMGTNSKTTDEYKLARHLASLQKLLQVASYLDFLTVWVMVNIQIKDLLLSIAMMVLLCIQLANAKLHVVIKCKTVPNV